MTLPEINTDTLAAAREADDIINGRIQAKSYSTLQEMIDEITAEGFND